jgi:hypothetical protein
MTVLVALGSPSPIGQYSTHLYQGATLGVRPWESLVGGESQLDPRSFPERQVKIRVAWMAYRWVKKEVPCQRHLKTV